MKLLDNIFWNALTEAQAQHAVGSGGARRYARGFSAIIGFADAAKPDFAGLRAHCEPSEQLYYDDWTGVAPSDWRIVMESRMFKMVWDGMYPAADAAPDATPLTREHAAQALELAELTKPGPFALRTLELGEYFGYFAGSRLIAMAGERAQAGHWREISGVSAASQRAVVPARDARQRDSTRTLPADGFSRVPTNGGARGLACLARLTSPYVLAPRALCSSIEVDWPSRRARLSHSEVI